MIDLKRFQQTFSVIPGAEDHIAQMYTSHIKHIGLNYIEKEKTSSNKPNAQQFISSLIEFHDKMLNITINEFEEKQIYHKALKEGFEEFINREYFISALLARFANDILKKGVKTSVANFNIESIMDTIVVFYQYIRDKV